MLTVFSRVGIPKKLSGAFSHGCSAICCHLDEAPSSPAAYFHLRCHLLLLIPPRKRDCFYLHMTRGRRLKAWEIFIHSVSVAISFLPLFLLSWKIQIISSCFIFFYHLAGCLSIYLLEVPHLFRGMQMRSRDKIDGRLISSLHLPIRRRASYLMYLQCNYFQMELD